MQITSVYLQLDGQLEVQYWDGSVQTFIVPEDVNVEINEYGVAFS